MPGSAGAGAAFVVDAASGVLFGEKPDASLSECVRAAVWRRRPAGKGWSDSVAGWVFIRQTAAQSRRDFMKSVGDGALCRLFYYLFLYEGSVK